MLSIFRLVVGLLFLQHGMQKWFGIPSVNPAYANIQLLTMVGMAGVIEIICGSLVTVRTRYAAFIASGEMAVSYWIYSNRMARGFAPQCAKVSTALLGSTAWSGIYEPK